MDILIDAYTSESDSVKLGDRELIESVLRDLPSEIGMQIIGGPYVLTYDGGNHQNEYGVSGSVIIAESHVAIHTWPEFRFFQLRISSCKPVDYLQVIDYLSRVLGVISSQSETVEMGFEYARQKAEEESR